MKSKTSVNLSFLVSILAMIFLLPVSGCKKNTDYGDIPFVTVSITLPLSLPEYSALNAIGNYVDITGGYKGIIVYRKSLDQFAAYERACPYDPNEPNALITVDSSGVICVDHHCGSKFNIMDGSVLNGPATRPLKQYYTDYDSGSLTLYIHN